MRSPFCYSIVAVVVGCMLVALEATAQPLQYLYWLERESSTSRSIKRGVVGDTATEELVTGQENLGGFAVNPVEGTLYWTLREDVLRMSLDEARPDTIMTSVSCGISDRLGGLELDLRARKLYVMVYSSCTNPFLRANLDGSGREGLLVISDGESPTSFVVDSTTSKVYWRFRVQGSHIGILRANPDGTERERIVPDVPATGLALDLEAGRVYWTERSTGKIRRANMDGSEVEDVLTGLDRPASITFDPIERMLYWNVAGAIRRARLDGTGVEDVFTGLASAGGIKVVSVTGTSMEPGPTTGLPGGFVLAQNHPNPFRSSTTIEYVLDRAQRVRLAVHDLFGRELTVLVDGVRTAGEHTVRWEADGQSAGVYVVRLESGGEVAARRLTLVR